MDASLGRFTTVDPMAESAYSWSPYAYCKNNPVKFIDPDGKREWPINETYKGYKKGHENNWYAPRGKTRRHQGVDINYKGAKEADKGSPILATHDGKVTRVAKISKDKNAGGNRVQITSSDGEVSTFYMHLDKIDNNIKVGTVVSEGQEIGTMGGSGKGKTDEYASHLHYEISVNGKNIDPTMGEDGLVDPQNLIAPVEGGELPEVTVFGIAPTVKVQMPTIDPVVIRDVRF